MARRRNNSKHVPSKPVQAFVTDDPFRPTVPEPAVARMRAALKESLDHTPVDPILEAIASVPPPALEQPAPLDDVSDPGSIAGQFFASEKDSVPPPVELPSLEEPVVPEPPEVAARRGRMRRVVSAAVAVCGLFALAAVGKSIASRGDRAAAVAAATQASFQANAQLVVQQPQVQEPAVAAEPAPVEPKVEAPVVPAKAEVAPESLPEPPPVADQDESEPPAVDPAAASKLRKEAESLLNRGKYKDALEAARAAIAADPSHALPYLYLGTSLQMTGKWKDGIEAYCDCVRNATQGPIYECRAAGGHK